MISSSFVVTDREGNWKAYTSSWQCMYVWYPYETWNRGLYCVISFTCCVWNALHCPFMCTMYVTQVTWWVKVVNTGRGGMIESMNKHAGIWVDSEDALQQETGQRRITILLMLSRLTWVCCDKISETLLSKKHVSILVLTDPVKYEMKCRECSISV